LSVRSGSAKKFNFYNLGYLYTKKYYNETYKQTSWDGLVQSYQGMETMASYIMGKPEEVLQKTSLIKTWINDDTWQGPGV
jgi:hypothetical protein